MYRCLLMIGVAVLLTSGSWAKEDVKLPSYFDICTRDDRELDNCLKNSIQKIVRSFENGDKTLGVHPFDPFMSQSIKLDFGQDSVKAKIVGKDITMVGINTIQVRDVRSQISDDSLKMEVDVFFDKTSMEGYYKIDGDFYSFPLKSRGYFNITMDGVAITWKLSGRTEERDGKTYMKIESFTLDPTVTDMHLFLTGLFPNNEELNNLAVGFVNQYWGVMYKNLLPLAEKNWNPVLVNTANLIFSQFPYDVLLPATGR